VYPKREEIFSNFYISVSCVDNPALCPTGNSDMQVQQCLNIVCRCGSCLKFTDGRKKKQKKNNSLNIFLDFVILTLKKAKLAKIKKFDKL
jgi:hypothetical protein